VPTDPLPPKVSVTLRNVHPDNIRVTANGTVWFGHEWATALHPVGETEEQRLAWLIDISRTILQKAQARYESLFLDDDLLHGSEVIDV
jgi:hypothetical protein